MPTKRERLEEFYRRLGPAPAPAGHDEAWRLITRVLTEVEDDLSGVSRDPHPPPKPKDGRMYPPMADKVFDVPGRPAVKRLRSAGHNILIGNNGAIEIRSLDGAIEFTKAGADGRWVGDL
jgi:hypothetical protein